MIEHLQINDVTPCVHYDADGVQAAFTFPFAVFKAADLEVWQDRVRMPGGFSVSGAGISSGGAVLFTVPPAAGTRVTLRRRMALERISDFQTDGIIRAKTLNDELDYQVAAVQQVADDVSRCVQRPFTSSSTADLSLPDPVPGRSLKWNAAGDGLVNSDYDPDTVMTLGAAAAASALVAEGHKDVAQACADSAAESAAAAAGYAAAINLPSGAGHAFGYMRQKGDESGLEYRTPAQVLADLGGQSAADAQAQIAVLDVAMQSVRDQGVLTALRQMLNTSVGTGALIRGKQWELSTDEWGATSTGESYVNGAVSYYTGSAGVSVVSGATGTALGTFTGGGGLAAAFDGNIAQNSVSGPASGSNAAFHSIGKQWGAARTLHSAQIVTNNANDGLMHALPAGVSVILELRGSNTNNASTATVVGSASISNKAGANTAHTITATDVSASYTYHWVTIRTAGGDTSSSYFAECTFYDYIAPAAVTLVVPAAVTINNAPAYADLFFLWKDDSGTALAAPSGTIRLSRDGGATTSVATVTVEAAFDATYSIIRARADVSGQPNGSSLWADINFGTVKQRFAAPALLGE